MIDLKMLIWGGGGALMLFAVLICFLYIWSNWAEIKMTVKGNCLVWSHPDNSDDGMASLDIRNIKDAPGPIYQYKSFWFLPEKSVKWCYDIKVVNKETGVIGFELAPYFIDNHLDTSGKTSGQLANALDWRPAKRLLRQKAKIMEKAAQGGIILLGCASLFGIMMLLDMLGKS